MAEAGARARFALVEVDIRGEAPLAAFSGARTTHARFSATSGVKWVPTLIFVDASGNALTDPLIGLTVPDLYQGLLERRLEQAIEKLRRP